MRSRPKIKFSHWFDDDGDLFVGDRMKTHFGDLTYERRITHNEMRYSTSIAKLLLWSFRRIQKLMNHHYLAEVERNKNA